MEKWMKLAIESASKAKGWTAPNPLVGAVIVKNEKCLAVGQHAYYGGAHAEVDAISAATEPIEGADLYVTLEPCAHYGKTPPCVDAIIKSGIQKVIVGMVDPNPMVSGKGIMKLKESGIHVVVGVLESECHALNKDYIFHMRTGMPYVTLKYAMSMDGKIALNTGESQWITGTAARKQVHKERHEHMAILTGINTILKDNPELTCRLYNGKNPIRLILDSKLRLPLDSKIVKTAQQIRTVVFCSETEKTKATLLKKNGIDVVEIGQLQEGLNLMEVMKWIGDKQINSLYVEAGAKLCSSLIYENLVHEINVYMGQLVLGGAAFSPFEGFYIDQMKSAKAFSLDSMKSFDGDVELIYRRI